MSIKDIKWVRSETGASLADCKKALEETDNDLEKARDLAIKLKYIRAEADEGLVLRKRAEMEEREQIRQEEARQHAQQEAERRNAEQQARLAELEAELDARIARVRKADADLTEIEAQIGVGKLTDSMVIVESYEVGYKSSAGRFQGRVIRAMSCRGLIEAQERLSGVGLQWDWDYDQCYDQNGQAMSTRTDLEWWDFHGDGDSEWYRDDVNGGHRFEGIEHCLSPMTELEIQFVHAG